MRMMLKGVIPFVFLCLLSSIVWCACPVGWFPFHTSCYLFGNTSGITFAQAEQYCQQQQCHLVTVEDKPENVFLKNKLYHLKGIDYWMGLTDNITEGTWLWNSTNTNVTFTDWYPGAPDSYYGDEDCATFASFASYRWNDVNCTYQYRPLCEKSMPATGPAVG